MEDMRFGKCEWCGKHNVPLNSVIGQHDGQLWCGWICTKCLDEAYKRDWGKYINGNERS